ncbi:MAG: hypothetical protein D6732_14645 [Methanobacteriota archaeon]|nr:MAG: hypothetical protein D6732_14645 [Euryarchaeota archaeon]
MILERIVAEPYTPIIAGKFLVASIWIMSIIAVASLVLFSLYTFTSKEKSRKGIAVLLLLSALTIAIDLQLILYQNGVTY